MAEDVAPLDEFAEIADFDTPASIKFLTLDLTEAAEADQTVLTPLTDFDARFATIAQGALADTAVQPGDLATVATTGVYADLSGTPTLGTMANQDANSVSITGGSIAGITDLAVADGGTGAGTAAGALTNLGAAGLALANVFTAAQTVQGSTTTTVPVTIKSTDDNTTNNLLEWQYSAGTVGLSAGVSSFGFNSSLELKFRNNSKILDQNTRFLFLVKDGRFDVLNDAGSMFIGRILRETSGEVANTLDGGTGTAGTTLMLRDASTNGAGVIIRADSTNAPTYCLRVQRSSQDRFRILLNGNTQTIAEDPTNNDILNVVTIGANVTGASHAANNFGSGILFTGETSTIEDQNMAQIGAGWNDSANATRSADIIFKTVHNAVAITDASAEKFRIVSDGGLEVVANLSTDVAPNDDTTKKKLTIQRLAAAPTNAAYIQFSNGPGSPANEFYLVLEEG